MSVRRNSRSLFSKLKERMRVSPDFCELKYRKEIPVFVHDNLKYGTWENFKYLQGAKYLGRAQTFANHYIMKGTVDNCIVFEDKSPGARTAVIRGEVYLVSPQHILLLDDMMNNNKEVDRTLIRVLYFDQAGAECLSRNHKYATFQWSHAFIYLGRPQVFSKMNFTYRTIRTDLKEIGVIKSKPYFEWDTWESSWPFHSPVQKSNPENRDSDKEDLSLWGGGDWGY